MIEVKTYLYNRAETILHANFADQLISLREREKEIYTSTPLLPGDCGTQTGPAVVTDAVAAPAPTPPAPTTNDVAPEAGTVADLSQIGVERTFRAFIAAKGAAAARTILDKYNAPRLGDVKEEQLAAFVTDLVRA